MRRGAAGAGKSRGPALCFRLRQGCAFGMGMLAASSRSRGGAVGSKLVVVVDAGIVPGGGCRICLLFVGAVRRRAGSPPGRRPGGVMVWLSLVGAEESKGIWWMPWRQEAMKDVARCEKPWGAASRL